MQLSEPSAIATLGWIARANAIARKTPRFEAEEWLAANRAPDAVRRIFKAAVGGGTTVDSDLGPGGGASITAWVDALRTPSVFYRLLGDNSFIRAPLNTRVAMVSSMATGALVPEGHGVPVSRVTLHNMVLVPQKAGALIVITDELLRNVSAAGQACVNKEIAACVSLAVDSAFLSGAVDTGTTAITATGTTATAAKKDLRSVLLATNSIGQARLYWIASPNVAKMASTLADTNGVDAFPEMGASADKMTGSAGMMAGLPCLVSSAVPAGELYLIDASGFACDAGPVTVDASLEADVQMDTSPGMTSSTPTPATTVSMFGTNNAALRATAWFGAQKLRENALSIVTGINWGN